MQNICKEGNEIINGSGATVSWVSYKPRTLNRNVIIDNLQNVIASTDHSVYHSFLSLVYPNRDMYALISLRYSVHFRAIYSQTTDLHSTRIV